MLPVLYVVVPCYNEEAVLPETLRRLRDKLSGLIAAGACHAESRLLFVDDGSRDATWAMIEAAHREDERVCGLKLAHNRGHQNALYAGLMAARDRCDCAASMDADLQDDINVLDGFLQEFQKGCDVVYGVRSARESDSAFKRLTAEGYYKVLQKLGVEVVFNHADCRLLSRRALQELSHYREVNLFLRGMVAHMGFRRAVVTYPRAPRFAGESKYPLSKMLSLAWDGITSFSLRPLTAIARLGGAICLLSFLALVVEGVAALCSAAVPGLLAAVTSLWLLGGMVLLSLGVVGSYLGRLYAEVKGRPRFAVESALLPPARFAPPPQDQ